MLRFTSLFPFSHYLHTGPFSFLVHSSSVIFFFFFASLSIAVALFISTMLLNYYWWCLYSCASFNIFVRIYSLPLHVTINAFRTFIILYIIVTMDRVGITFNCSKIVSVNSINFSSKSNNIFRLNNYAILNDAICILLVIFIVPLNACFLKVNFMRQQEWL